jgi:hypothetical protein
MQRRHTALASPLITASAILMVAACGGDDDSSSDNTNDNTNSNVDQNRPPSVDSIEIEPSNPYNDDTLTCQAIASDPDGVSPQLDYIWTSADGTQLATGAAADLSAVSVWPDDTITCSVLASDTEGATDMGQASVTVANRAPTIETVEIEPQPLELYATATCAVTATDPDGETTSVTRAWTNDTTSADLGAGQSVSMDPSVVSAGDVIQCDVTVTDDAGDQAVGVATSTVVEPALVCGDVNVPSGTNCDGTDACTCQGCVDDGNCTTEDDCVCAECTSDAYCGDPANCVDDGVCSPFNESCVCEDCAAHPECQ